MSVCWNVLVGLVLSVSMRLCVEVDLVLSAQSEVRWVSARASWRWDHILAMEEIVEDFFLFLFQY